MPRVGPPGDQGLLVSPAREREEPSRPSEAAIANVFDEAVDLLQLRAKPSASSKVGLAKFRPRLHLEDHAEHSNSSSAQWQLGNLLRWQTNRSAPPEQEAWRRIGGNRERPEGAGRALERALG